MVHICAKSLGSCVCYMHGTVKFYHLCSPVTSLARRITPRTYLPLVSFSTVYCSVRTSSALASPLHNDTDTKVLGYLAE
jgi:hypothetical protein